MDIRNKNKKEKEKRNKGQVEPSQQIVVHIDQSRAGAQNRAPCMPCIPYTHQPSDINCDAGRDTRRKTIWSRSPNRARGFYGRLKCRILKAERDDLEPGPESSRLERGVKSSILEE